MKRKIDLDDFDSDKTILVYVEGNFKIALGKFGKIGDIETHEYDEENNILIIEYTDANSVLNAINTVFDERFICLKEVINNNNTLKNNLSVPLIINNYLTSPPPSPPEGWNAISEDINRVKHVDLEEIVLNDGKIQLLPKSESSPSIIIDPDC